MGWARGAAAIVVLVGCGPSYSVFRGDVQVTITEGAAGGAATSRVAPAEAAMCWYSKGGYGYVRMRLSDTCNIDAWASGEVAPGNRCALSVAGRRTAFTVNGGAFDLDVRHETNPVTASVSGVTEDGRYVILRLHGIVPRPGAPPPDYWCATMR